MTSSFTKISCVIKKVRGLEIEIGRFENFAWSEQFKRNVKKSTKYVASFSAVHSRPCHTQKEAVSNLFKMLGRKKVLTEKVPTAKKPADAQRRKLRNLLIDKINSTVDTMQTLGADSIADSVLEALEGKLFDDGFRAACALVDDLYAASQTHPYMLGDCVLAKTNRLKPRAAKPNPLYKPRA